MAIDFPTDPVDGQIFTTEYKTYVYNATTGAWKSKVWVQDNIFTVGGFVPGFYDANEVLMLYTTSRPFVIPNGFANSYGYAVTASASTVVFGVYKNADQIGTITFDINDKTPSFAGNGGSFAAGDYLKVVAAATNDVSLADISFTFKGTKN